jgi:hypothetical protein
VRATFRQPFDLLAETTAIAARHKVDGSASALIELCACPGLRLPAGFGARSGVGHRRLDGPRAVQACRKFGQNI